MILQQPICLTKYDDKVHYFDIRFRSIYKNYDSTFLILNPFNIENEDLSWIDFTLLSKRNLSLNLISRSIKDLYGIIKTNNSSESLDFNKILNLKNVVPPNVDQMAFSIYNKFLKYMVNLGAEEVLLYFNGENFRIRTRNLINDQKPLIADMNLVFPKYSICLSQEFDQLTTSLSGDKDLVIKIVDNCGLEGFFVDKEFNLLWDQNKV